ncbi:hypothetical protein MMC30_004707 [Trapelia coarctata]|nr:hypothetical protein [Trapelia coarctata]
MHFQFTLLTLPLIFSCFTAAHQNPDGNTLYARRSNALLRARNAAAELDFYNKLIARHAEPEPDYYESLVARDADPEPDYYDDLVPRDAEPELDYFDHLIARDAEPEHDHDHALFARTPGNSGSKTSGSGGRVSDKAPQHPKIMKCELCGGICPTGQTFCKNSVYHKGAAGMCVEAPGQRTKRWAGENLYGDF